MIENYYSKTEDSESFRFFCMADVETEPVEWLWKPYIPLGKITVLQGDPGTGKTYLATNIAAILSSGRDFPYGDNSDRKWRDTPVNVIYQTAEDGLGDTLKVRLEEAGANCENIYVINETIESFTLDDIRLRETVRFIRPKLVVIDPLQAYLGSDVDMHRANEIRPVMARLGSIAADYKCAFLLIGHQNKASGGKNIYRGLGSIDIIAAARSVLAVNEMPGCKTQRAVAQIKSSLAPNGETVLFELDPVVGFAWAGTSELTGDELANGSAGKEASARDGCADFLRDLLKSGEMYAADVFKAAEMSGYAEGTIRRAKEKANILHFKEKIIGGKWIWKLGDLEDSNTKKT